MRYWSVWLFCISLALRLFSIGASIFWYDEAFTAAVTRLDFASMMQAVHGDVHPPLWYFIDWSVSHLFGQSEFLLRVPAALFGSLGCVALYALMNRLVGQREAAFSSGLMSIMPGQLYYSQEARMYSLFTLLVLLAAYAIVTRRWRMMGICFALILFTQTLGIVYVGLMAAYSLFVSRGDSLRACLLGAVAYLPQLPTTILQITKIGSGYWIPEPGNFGAALMYVNFTTLFVRWPPWALLSAMIASGGFTIGSVFILRHDLRRLALPMLLAFGPALTLYLISVMWRPMILDRALLPSGAILSALWGMAGSRLSRRFAKPAMAVALPVLLAGLISYYIDPNEQRPLTYVPADLIRPNWQTGDVVYHLNVDSVISQSYYLREKPFYLMPDRDDFVRGGLTSETRGALGINNHLLAFDELVAHGYRRVWFIGGWAVMSSKAELDTLKFILQRYPVVAEWHLDKTRLYESILYLVRL